MIAEIMVIPINSARCIFSISLSTESAIVLAKLSDIFLMFPLRSPIFTTALSCGDTSASANASLSSFTSSSSFYILSIAFLYCLLSTLFLIKSTIVLSGNPALKPIEITSETAYVSNIAVSFLY